MPRRNRLRRRTNPKGLKRPRGFHHSRNSKGQTVPNWARKRAA